MCFDTTVTVGYALLIALVLRTFVIEPFKIPSGSMLPTLLVGDFLFVSKYSYGYSRYSFPLGIFPFSGRIVSKKPKRGDVIVFRNPKRDDVNYVKRVIGLPGDTIQIKRGVLFINDNPARRTEKPLPTYIRNNGRAKNYIETFPNGHQHEILETSGDTGFADDSQLYRVPDGQYFMMGDNRDNSSDSRFLSDLGYVPLDHIVGRVEFIFFSHDFSGGYKIRFSRLFSSVT
ncbi:MAG: signal peptidase I [Alphaproteobacteria bacterium]|nr:signal peptidase I [Alphaproteobacteria bacterium]